MEESADIKRSSSFLKGNRRWLLIILFLGLLLRLYNLDRYPLWYDEASTALNEDDIFHLPPILKYLEPGFSLNRLDHMFLYQHSIVYYWKKIFGDSALYLRLSSVFFGMLGLYAVYKLGELVYSKKIALISAFLLAISSFHVQYSQELGAYAAMSFFGLLAFYALFKIVKEGRKIHWVIYVLANIISIYCHYMMSVVLLAEFVILMINLKYSKRSLAGLIAVHLAILFAITPLLIIIFQNLLFVLTERVDIDLSEFPVWGQRVYFSNILFTLKNFSIGYYADFYSLAGLAATFIYLFFYILGNCRDNYKLRAMSNIALLTAPIFFIFTASRFVKPCYIDRYFLVLLPVYLLGVANGLSYPKKLIRYFSLAVILLFSLVGLRNYYKDMLPKDNRQHVGIMPKKNRADDLSRFILANFQNKDALLVTTKLVIFPLKFYINKFLPEYYTKNKTALTCEMDPFKLIRLDNKDNLIVVPYKGDHPPPGRPYPFTLSGFASRVWVVYSLSDPRPAIMDKIKDIFIEEEKYSFEGLELYLFVRKQEN